MVDQGSDGVCILANYSEQFLLSDQERHDLTCTSLEHVAGRVPVIVTISHFATDIVAARARQAMGMGADIVMMMAPYLGAALKGAPDQVFEQFAREFFGLETLASEFKVARGMWNGRVSSHVAMKDVPELLTIERIGDSIELADRTLKTAGYDRPRIVVAAYNPHAGDGGLMGDEEIRVIRPAVERARQRQINCVGPLPADTLWLKVRDGDYDVVVTMHHDQGQIAIKLLGFDRGVSVLAGLPLPVTTPAHGTAFDIAGKAKANLVPAKNAYTICLNMASNRAATDGVDPDDESERNGADSSA